MHPTQQQADANRAVLRQRIAELSWQSTDPAQHLIGAAYANYDREPEAMRGALDLALDTATDPLTSASLGSDAIAGAAGRVVGQAPQISEAMRDGGAGILRGHDDAASNVLRSSQRLQPVGAGVPASVSDRSGVGVLEKRPISVGAPSRGNFSADEAAGGHTIAKHFYKSDAKLRGRFEREPDLQQSSAFLNEASASKAFSSLEKQHAREINDWKKSGSHNLFTRKVNVGSPIGRVLVLVADSSQRGWHVLTAFPVRQ